MDVLAGVIGCPVVLRECICQKIQIGFSEVAKFARLLSVSSCTFMQSSRVCGFPPPSLLRDGSILAAAVGHVANGTALRRELELSDACTLGELLGEAWLKWGARVGDRVIGDWALAIWSGPLQQLALARSAASSFPMFFAEHGGIVYFASLAQALSRALPAEPTPDWSAIAHFMGHMVLPDIRTAFSGIRRVPAGRAMIWQRGEWSDKAIWSPRVSADHEPRDWASDLRQAVEASVADRLPSTGWIASQLSGGRDSSAVTAVASLLAPDRVTAITFAPRPGTVPHSAQRLIFDESQQARATATALGIKHVLVDGGSIDDQLHWLRASQKLAFLPLISAPGAGLRMAVAAAAASTGAETMLAGAFGNLGLSSGGIAFLSDLRREDGTAAWFGVARQIATSHGWKTVLHQSAPVRLRQALRDFRERRSLCTPSMWAGSLAAAKVYRNSYATAAQTAREEVFLVIREMEMADFAPDAFHHVRLVDPTTDRRIVELALTAPARLMVDQTLGRPLYEAAFADLLPRALLQERRRGRQAADWWTAFSPDLVRSALEETSAHSIAGGVIDKLAAETLLKCWPNSFQDALRREAEFQELFGSLSIALFLFENF